MTLHPVQFAPGTACQRCAIAPALLVPNNSIRPSPDVPAALGAPGDALQSSLERAGGDVEFASLEVALPLGPAQSIQRQRRALIDGQIPQRRAITAKAYWATGKKGL
jgi:hypothetical protein